MSKTMQWPACFLICCWNEGMAGVNTAAQPQHKTLTYNYFHKFKGLIKLCVQLVKKGEKRRLNCEYIQCNKHRKPYHTHTWYKTNGRNHILEYETHKDAAAFNCVCCLIRHNRCRVFICSTCIYHDYTNSLFWRWWLDVLSHYNAYHQASSKITRPFNP
jgi:hypothetical protein